MQPVESYKILGLTALCIFWLTTAVMLWRLRGDNSKSISRHAATTSKVAFIFGISGFVSTVLLLIFFVNWFLPTFDFGDGARLLVVAAFILFGIAGVVPDTQGLAHRIHLVSAVTASILLVPIMVLMMSNRAVSSSARVFIAFALACMLYLWFAFKKTRNNKEKFLIYQSAYFLCFDISILVVTYIR